MREVQKITNFYFSNTKQFFNNDVPFNIIFFKYTMEETQIDLNIKIKQEKLSPERKSDDNEDELDKILNSKIFCETDEKKDLEPAK